MRDIELHEAVMVEEVVNNLIINSSGRYLDCTFGVGGHSRAILNRLDELGNLIAFERDSRSRNKAEILRSKDKRLNFFQTEFSKVGETLETRNLDGLLADLGISSFQLDDAKRGFSFNQIGSLDMRMNQDSGVTAEDWINGATKKELEDIFWHLGEDRNSRRIAKRIIITREKRRITNTKELSEIILSTSRKRTKRHPATNIFRAIRMHINGEIQELKDLLAKSEKVLNIGGRIAIISFHSIEDRLVKRFFQGKDRQDNSRLKAITKKPIKPTDEEIKKNPRSRSAILRVAEKVC